VERFTVGILALVAQRERELISDRTKSALEAARKRDVRLGTKNPNRQVKLMVAGYRRQKIAFVSKIRQVCTRRANFWFPSTVQTVVG
jgi:DNA invertase Pin-like site-specific DNA recombinase